MKSWKQAAILIGALTLLPVEALAGQWALARLSFSSGWDALPSVVTIERGFFAEEKLVVSGLAVSSAQHVVNSVAAGSTDFAAVPQRTLLAMAALKMPVKVVSMNGWGTEMELVVPKDDTIVKSIADLRNRTIAVGVGSEAYPILIRLLNKAKMRPKDVTIKTLPGADLTRALQSKAAAAVLESRHFTSALVESGQARPVLTHKDIVRALGLIGAGALVVRQDIIEKEPATVQKLLNAWIKGLKYIEQDPEDAARLLQIFFHRQGAKVSEEMARSWIAMTHYDRFSWSPAEVADAEFNGWGLKEGGALKVIPKLDGYVENRFAQEALKRIAGSSGPAPQEKPPASR